MRATASSRSTPLLSKGDQSTLDDCVAAMDYLINPIGEESVGIGIDWVQDQDIGIFNYLSADKGRRRPTTRPYTKVPPMPQGLETLGDFGNFVPAMERAGWSETSMHRVLGEN